ncbi:hypothetical protein [Paenibacillus pseudetheri]|uniref:Heparin-sulfate lyase N-terminal domain-containing protein n=1 Tax=Paenibacillus pseudetheri TaxID=2897682 RepID=A0ABM9BFG8_9BACL|nr:hypothetical protein [Paenibacillus pseudetheri]CAH1057730.1 hypothetical protein PAECIP111894_03903 [Paenibacillus pseudetheri]
MSSTKFSRIHEEETQWLPFLKKALEPKHVNYNEEIKLLRTPFTSPGYHTKLRNVENVHPIRESLDYALAILDCHEDPYKDRAFEILRTILSLQDQQPDSPTFGIWSWYFEEPLSMMSPPDWNWADFIGRRLLQVLIRHSIRLPGDLEQLTSQAISHSCEAIIKRNVGPDYTNIAIMGAFVTLIAGERLKNRTYFEYGLERLTRLYDYSMQTGAFLEYNSPAYSTVAILELSALVMYSNTAEAKRLANEMLEATWLTVAEHFHPLLKQWSGPHARSYQTFLSNSHLSFLQMACKGDVSFVSDDEFLYGLEWYAQGIVCPERLYGLFTRIVERELRQDLPPYHEFRTRKAYTYMTPEFTLGTFNHNVMWKQCRNLLGYVHTGNQGRSYIQLRVLHDGYDFCSAVYTSVQEQASVLYGIQFALDGGDTHVNLDPIHGRMTASDLRIRLEIGSIGDVPAWKQIGKDAFQTYLGEMTLSVKALYGTMDEFSAFHWELVEEGPVVSLDYVLYEGDPTTIDFHAMEEALFMFALTLCGPDEESDRRSSLSISEHEVQTSLESPDQSLTLKLAKKPAERVVLFHN